MSTPSVTSVMESCRVGNDLYRYSPALSCCTIECDGETLRQILEYHYDEVDPNWQAYVTMDDFDRPDFEADP